MATLDEATVQHERERIGEFWLTKHDGDDGDCHLWDVDYAAPERQSWGWGAGGAELLRIVENEREPPDWMYAALASLADPTKPVRIRLKMEAERIE